MTQQTSLFAYQHEIKPMLGERQKAVYNELEKNGAMTNNEIASSMSIPINTVTPRVFELRKVGLVRQAGIRTCRVTGRKVISWEVGKII